MTLSVVLLPFLSRTSIRKTVWLAMARFLAGFCYLLAAWKPELQPYAFWVFLGGLPGSVVYPLLTSVYHENYPHRIRGQLFAWASMVTMASSAALLYVVD